MAEGAEERCIACGHCVAVCHKAAVALDGMEPDDCLPLEPGLIPNSDAAEHLLMTRRSTRAFRDKPIARDTLEELVDIARWAPSARNRQPVSWIVLTRPEQVRNVAELTVEWLEGMAERDPEQAQAMDIPSRLAVWREGRDFVCRGAPHLLLAHAPAGVAFMAQDCAVAVNYVEVAAQGHRLGTCWAGFVTRAAAEHPALVDYLHLPEGREIYGGVMLGFPKHRHRRIPARFAAEVDWR